MNVGSVPIRLRRKVRRALGRGPATPARSSGFAPACNAPFTSMYLDQHGFVRACCMNDFQLLGNVAEQRLVDIWHGEPARELRDAMVRHDLTVGCEFCKWQVDEGRADLAFSRWFTEYVPSGPEPDWPQQLELSISNTCNLQCVMCNGEWSSSIRSQREHREPLPKVYDEQFFEDLREFVPHLRRVKFLGGEPFLAAETLRVMELLVEAGGHVRCHATTNGTQWSPRVERILDMLPVDVAVSLDAATKETYESIRIGSTWEQVQDHLDRFCERAERNGTDVTVTMCLMTNNWRDFLGFCQAADARGIGCAVNTVTMPAHLSLYRVPVDELAVVVEELEHQERTEAHRLGRSRATWSGELDKLRQHLASKQEARVVTGLDHRRLNPDLPRPFRAAEGGADDASAPDDGEHGTEVAVVVTGGRADAGAPDVPSGPYLVLDDQNVVVSMEGGDEVTGIPAREWVGTVLDDLMEVVTRHHGAIEALDTVEVTSSAQVFEVAFEGGRRARAVVVPFTHGPDGGPGRLHLAWVGDGS